MKTSYAVGIGIALVLAIGIFSVVAEYQVVSPTQDSTRTSGNGSTTGTLAGAAPSTASGASVTTSSGASQGQGATGDFAAMATDPPVVASGVTAATVAYDSLAVHTAGSDNASGWVQVKGSGTINLMNSANVSQTIGEAKIQSGTYDMVRLGIQSASVTYNSQAYAAAVASSNVTARLRSDAQVSSSQGCAALIDLRTFVINAANSSKPEFIFSASAQATAVPPAQVTAASLQLGAQTNLQGNWWAGFNDQTSTAVSVSSATLTNGSLSLHLKNAGNDTANIQTIIVTPVSSAGAAVSGSLPASLSGSAVFTVNGTGSVQTSNSLQGAILLGGNSTKIGTGSSATLNYNGSVSLGFGLLGIQLSGVVSGQQYLVTVMGANTYASTVVTAG